MVRPVGAPVIIFFGSGPVMGLGGSRVCKKCEAAVREGELDASRPCFCSDLDYFGGDFGCSWLGLLGLYCCCGGWYTGGGGYMVL